MQPAVTETLGRFAAETGADKIPSTALASAKLKFLDTLAVAVAFLVLPLVAIFLRIPPGELFAQLGSDVAVDALIVTLKTSLVAQAIIVLVEHGEGQPIELTFDVEPGRFGVVARSAIGAFDPDHSSLALCRVVLDDVTRRYDIGWADGGAEISLDIALTTD